jgi:hypothetical protein
MSFRLGVRRSLLRAGLLAVAATGVMAVAPAVASAVSHAPVVVSSVGAASFAHPASSCGNHPCVL